MSNLDGRRFRDVTPAPMGDVGSETVFEYHEADNGTIWGSYKGGPIERGFLVGTRTIDTLDFRYAHVTTMGGTASGHCLTRVEEFADGRLRLHEAWRWESKEGSGTSVLEEIAD